VPTYYNDQDIDILFVLPHNVSQTYIFDSASPPSASPKPPPPAARSASSKRFSRCSSLAGSRLHFRFRRSLSRSSSRASGSSSASASDTDESMEYKWNAQSSGFTLAQTKSALQFARSQLVNSEELTKLGANALYSERWSVTRLRKGGHHRLQITYFGRPARAVLSAPPVPPPPFMGLLAEL